MAFMFPDKVMSRVKIVNTNAGLNNARGVKKSCGRPTRINVNNKNREKVMIGFTVVEAFSFLETHLF